MGVTDVLWHLLGFLAMPVLLAMSAATLVKGVWRRELAAQPWWRMVARASGAAVLAAVVGLVVTGRDGAMLTYAAMLLACAAVLWWPLRLRR
jgi:hypothetical protein